MRVIVAADATIVWSADNWATTNKTDSTQISVLDLWFADLPTEGYAGGTVVEFTFFWRDDQRNEGRNYSVVVSGSTSNESHHGAQN